MKLKIKREYNEELAFILCYPYPSEEEYSERIEELISLGVDEIELVGPVRLGRVRVVGKGYRGVIVRAYVAGKLYALKIRRVDSERESLEDEALYTRIANAVNVGPSIYKYSRNFILREYVDGSNLPEWILEASSKDLRRCLSNLLFQAFALDMVGLDHGELARPAKHVLVTSDGRPVIIDFESASLRRRPRNLTRLTQYLFIRKGEVQEVIKSKLGAWDRDGLIEALREYKRTPSRRTFLLVMKTVGLYASERN